MVGSVFLPWIFPDRRSPHVIVLDDKLYVFGGFSYEFSEYCGWWRLMTPSQIHGSPCPVLLFLFLAPFFFVRMYAALESKQQIVVALLCDPKLKNFFTLFTYNISYRWFDVGQNLCITSTYDLGILYQFIEDL